MPVRAVVLPATPLLVPGAAGADDALVATRAAVAEALDLLVADLLSGGRLHAGLSAAGGPRAPVVVLAPTRRSGSSGEGPVPRRLRPSLAGAGIADRWVPGIAARTEAEGADGAAQVAASVALLCLDAALAARRAGHGGCRADGGIDVVTIELPAGNDALSAAQVDAVVAHLCAAAAVVVADAGAPPQGDEHPATARVLARCVDTDGWLPDVRTVLEGGEHVAPRYTVTVYRTAHGPGPAARRTVSG